MEGDLSSEFVAKRHENPDYELDIHLTGVRLPDGKVNWNVHARGKDAQDPKVVAQIFEKAAIILRGGGEDRVEP